MPRSARIKSSDSIYHIMLQNISDVLIFKCADDKDRYLNLIKKYQAIFLFKVYAYCLTDTNIHLLIDCNGADISKIMHSINQCYVQYYNHTYKRHGPLFYDRFYSSIIQDNAELIDTSAYISKIPNIIEGYENNEEEYSYSSFGVYTGAKRDQHDILDPSYILGRFCSDNITAREQYIQYVKNYDEYAKRDEMEFRNKHSEYRSEKHILVRNVTPDDIIDFVIDYTKTNKLFINIKYIREVADTKCLSAFLMRSLCDMNERDICRALGNISQSHVSKLCQKAVKIINEKPEYENIVKDFLSWNKFNNTASI